MDNLKSILPLNKKYFSWILIIGTVFLQIIFLLPGYFANGIGFPLDDAWIHQTYARNLVQSGSWSFIPGVVSGGSTSPLWTILLAPGFLFSGNFFYYWTIAISCAALCGLIYFLCKSLQNSPTGKNWRIVLLLGFLAASEWHLQWAAASGMETILYSLGIVLFTYLISRGDVNWIVVGIVAGLIIWIRPDGLTLLGPLVLVILQSLVKNTFSKTSFIKLILPFALILGGYLIFNYMLTGTIFPNTFYAKQMEYRELLDVSLWRRIINEFSPILVGVCLFLVPGFIYSFVKSIIKKNLSSLGMMLWGIGYVLLFAIRLPVVYQHGRYVIPVIPIFLLYGVSGWFEILAMINTTKLKKFASFGVWGTLVAVSVAFFAQGMITYRTDVNVIDTLMVKPAKWINQNTEDNAVIAVHDIGAMGFYCDRKLIDLAGLINPEVIPFIRDEEKIEDYINLNNANYFVGFNDWYKSSNNWGQEIKIFNMIMDEENEDVVIIKLDH